MNQDNLSIDPFEIAVDVYNTGEPLQLDVIPGADQSYLIVLDGVELSSVKHVADDTEHWVQDEEYNMPQETVDAIGEAIENHYM